MDHAVFFLFQGTKLLSFSLMTHALRWVFIGATILSVTKQARKRFSRRFLKRALPCIINQS